MTEDEPKRRSYAIDDVETIARRMKEIAAEREAAIAETELPCDVEPSAWTIASIPYDVFNAHIDAKVARMNCSSSDCNAMTREHVDGCPQWAPGIYTDEFWQPLIDAGILTVGDA
jgi:hypothetical protein